MEANPARLAGFSRREPQELKMSKKAEHDVIVALDLGTSKVVALVGEVNETGVWESLDWVLTRHAG